MTAQAMDQALRAADLLLQGGGFGAIVLDLGSTPAELAWKIPLATWFRFRAACERTRVSVLVLTQHPCARSAAELVVRMDAAELAADGRVMTGVKFRANIERSRYAEREAKVVPIRKPPQSERGRGQPRREPRDGRDRAFVPCRAPAGVSRAGAAASAAGAGRRRGGGAGRQPTV